jgi:hypothetical protein
VEFPAQHHTIVAAVLDERRRRYEAEARNTRFTAALAPPRGGSLLARLIAAVTGRDCADQLRIPASRVRRHFLLQYRASI